MARHKRQKKLTDVDLIRERVRGYDRQYYDSLYKQQLYTFGEPWKRRNPDVGEDEDFPLYPAVVQKTLSIGQSRRILNASLLALSRTLLAEPEPLFPDVYELTEELRKQFFLARYRGLGAADGNWGREIEQAWLDGYLLGTGFVHLGLRTNYATGYQYVDATHVPTTSVIWDPHAASPSRARWVAFVSYVAPEDAEHMFGRKAIEGQVKELARNVQSRTLRYVRVTDYYDVGCKGGAPTRCTFVGSWSAQPAVLEESVTRSLPMAYIEGNYVSGMDRPIGAVMMQIGTQEQINEIERALRKATREGSGVVLYDPQQCDPDDIKRFQSGQNVMIKIVNPSTTGAAPITRIPPQEVASTLLQYLQLMERQYNADSNQTDMDRGAQMATSRSATEVSILDARGQQSSIYIKRQTTLFFQRLVENALRVAAAGDRDPVWVDVAGTNVQINNLEDPAMRIDEILTEPSRVIIGDQSFSKQDSLRDVQERLFKLQQIAPLAGQTIDLGWYTEQLLRAVGERDPHSIMIQPREPAQTDAEALQENDVGGMPVGPEEQLPEPRQFV